MLGYILSGALTLGVITVFVVLIRRQLRWSHPVKGRGPGYAQGAEPDVPVSVTNPVRHTGAGGF
jgi:hypothetical protein